MSNDFLNITLIPKEIREKFAKWEYIELKICRTQKRFTRIKNQLQNGRKPFLAIHKMYLRKLNNTHFV
jgi:hypothetical protein